MSTELQQPLCSHCEQHVGVTKSSKQSKTTLMYYIIGTALSLVVITNLVLTIYMLSAMNKASTQLQFGTTGLTDMTTQLKDLNKMAGLIQDAFGPASRLPFNVFPVSVPDLLNEVLRMDFTIPAQNISRVAKAVDNVMRHFNDGNDMLQTAQYASLVQSITKQVALLKPVTNPAHSPPADDNNDDLVHFLISAAFNVIDLQVSSPKPWRQLASTCMDFIDNFLGVSWSGVYTGAYGNRLTWNINKAIHGPIRAVFDYCQAIANLTESEGDFFLGDAFMEKSDDGFMDKYPDADVKDNGPN
jgi:hypothetical protein